MRISGMVYRRPEDELKSVLESQQTIRISRLKEMLQPLLDKVAWQEETLERNVASIRALNDRAQRAEEKLKRANQKLSSLEWSYGLLKIRRKVAGDMVDYVENLLQEHNIDLEEESVAFAFHDSIVHVSTDLESNIMVVEVYATNKVIGIPLNFLEVISE